MRRAIIAYLVLAVPLAADMLSFDSAEEWAQWQQPLGLVQVGEQGQLSLVKFRKDINLVEDAHLFVHETRTRGDAVAGGLWQAGSNEADAPLAIDGDPTTYWQPSPDDAPEDWFITIDLGRAALAREIRLKFPDQEDARPFRQFRVFTTSGVRISATEDLFLYRQAFRTTRPNAESEIVIPLRYAGRDSALVFDLDLDLTPAERNHYRLIQYIQIISEEQNANAALAEVEVIGIGDNIAIGTSLRGNFREGDGTGSTPNLFDANLNTNNTVTGCRGNLSGWAEGGTWFRADLGATFFIDEMFLYSMRPDEGTLGFTVSGAGPGHTILFSDGTPATGTAPPVEVPENVDYEEVFSHPAPRADDLLYMRYLFEPRKARYLFWRGISCRGWGVVKWGELQLFSPGYPAQVELRSDFINLGEVAGDGRPKVIKALHWDADLPPGTRLQLRSRSGNALSAEFTFYNKKGDLVTEEKWNSLPKVIRGPVDSTLVTGEDWNEFSNIYQFSGETFKSASPRRFILLEMILSTDDPAVAPTVNSVSVEFEEALVQGARGSVAPREASPNHDTHFTYTLWPETDELDSGFDLMRFTVPEPVDLQSVSVMVGAESNRSGYPGHAGRLAAHRVAAGDFRRLAASELHYPPAAKRHRLCPRPRIERSTKPVAVGRGGRAPLQYRHVARTDRQRPAHQRPATGLYDRNPQRRRHQRPARGAICRLQSRGLGAKGGSPRPSRTPSSNPRPKRRRLATPLHLGRPRRRRSERRPRPVRPARQSGCRCRQ